MIATGLGRIPILLVEDDAVDVRMVHRVMEKEGMNNPIVWACDGVEALDILKGKHNKKISQPCILILDINMPRMNGFELLHEIRSCKNLKHTIVFIFTTSERDEDKEQAYNLGVAGYILKSNAGGFGQMLRSYCEVNEVPV